VEGGEWRRGIRTLEASLEELVEIGVAEGFVRLLLRDRGEETAHRLERDVDPHRLLFLLCPVGGTAISPSTEIAPESGTSSGEPCVLVRPRAQ
jgi:hypothetical protein